MLVLKWCDGSYLEDQDKFRMSGIFRDVYLMKRPKECICDYFIRTEILENEASVRIQTKYLDEVIPVKASVYDGEGEMVTEFVYKGDTKFTIPNPHLWNSEQPYLYTLVLETENEVITERIGIREICIKDNADSYHYGRVRGLLRRRRRRLEDGSDYLCHCGRGFQFIVGIVRKRTVPGGTGGRGCIN